MEDVNMKKIELMVMMQKNVPAYVFVADPRKIIKLVKIPSKGSVQEFQRPWQEKKVKEISKYAAGKGSLAKGAESNKKKAQGFLPGCININIKGELKITEENGKKFLDFPETEREFADFNGTVEILDGQHRLIAFSQEYINEDFKDDEKYQMCFVVYYQLTMEQKKEIFIVTNDWADKVDKNVMQNMMQSLGILSREDNIMFQLFTKLNKEDASPLKGRIIITGEKLKNGLKLLQLQAILKKSKTYEMFVEEGSDDILTLFQAITHYLRAWEQVYELDFNKKTTVTTLEKISGIRYIFNLYPTIAKLIRDNNNNAGPTTENIVPILKTLKEQILPADFSSSNPEIAQAFRGDSSTVALAHAHAQSLANLHNKERKRFFVFD